MKQKTPGINSFFKPIALTSTSNITGVENVNPYDEQPIANNNTDEQEAVVASVEVAEQCRIGSTTYERGLVSANKFDNSLVTRKKKHDNFLFWRMLINHT